MQETLGLFANRALRDGPDSPLIRFVREFEPYWREVQQPRIYALEGTFRALLRHGLLHDYPYLYALPPGRLGGIVALTDRVVANGRADVPRAMDCVIYFMDSRDPTSLLPDSVALKRECVVTGTTFLATHASAAEWNALAWFSTRAAGSDAPALGAHFVDTRLARKLFTTLPGDPAAQTIALIAHDSKKRDMVEFAAAHHDLLARYGRRLATGTTGALLNGEYPARLTRSWNETEDEAALFQALGRKPARLERALQETAALKRAVADLSGKLDTRPWVEAQPSGPRGGDIQIAEEVRVGRCHKLLFFEDPHVSREHEADIQLLERTTRIPGYEVSCLHDAASASRWAERMARCMELGSASPTTLVQAYRALWGVELILAGTDGQGEAQAVPAGTAWNALVERAAWYLHGLIAQKSRERLAAGANLRVALTWGREMHELALALGAVPERLAALERSHAGLHQPLLDSARTIAPNLVALPATGTIGAADPKNEASLNAALLARQFGGSARTLPLYAYGEDSLHGAATAPLCAELAGDWRLADIVMSTCDGLRPHFSENARVPIPSGLHALLEREAAGEIAGMYITQAGQSVDLGGYYHTGMPRDDLARVARAGGSVLMAGVQPRRAPAALAALRGGLVSTLVSDPAFARRVLELHAEQPA